MTTPYRESGRTVEERWANRPRKLTEIRKRGLLSRAWSAFVSVWSRFEFEVREWLRLWVDMFRALTVWKWSRSIRDARWSPVLVRETDLPQIPNSLDGLAAPVYDFEPGDLSVLDLLSSGCPVELVPDPEAEARALFYYAWMEKQRLYLAKRTEYMLAIPEAFRQEEPPLDAERKVVEERMRMMERYYMVTRPLWHAVTKVSS